MREPNEGHRDSYPCYWCSVAQLEVTHEDLCAESLAIKQAMRAEHAREMEKVRDQLNHLNKTDTLARMATEIFLRRESCDQGDAVRIAESLYHTVQYQLTGEPNAE